MESGVSTPSREIWRVLADLYHVSLDWLCDESNHTLDQEASATEADIDDVQKPASVSLHPVHAQDGRFHYLTVENISISKTIKINKRGHYTFAIRNNSSDTITDTGFVKY